MELARNCQPNSRQTSSAPGPPLRKGLGWRSPKLNICQATTEAAAGPKVAGTLAWASNKHIVPEDCGADAGSPLASLNVLILRYKSCCANARTNHHISCCPAALPAQRHKEPEQRSSECAQFGLFQITLFLLTSYEGSSNQLETMITSMMVRMYPSNPVQTLTCQAAKLS